MKKAIKLAKGIVLVQGSIFIRDLLRKKKSSDSSVRIGVTKEEVLDNLISAIRSGSITLEDIEGWIEEVEGWGRQHVYLYRTTSKLASSRWLRSPAALQRRLTTLGLDSVWNSAATPSYPDTLQLGRVAYDGQCLELSWHKRTDQWRREPDMDHPREVIEGDTYEFRAYRQVLKRALLRLVVYPSARKAGLFIQIPLGDPEHVKAREIAAELGAKLFDWKLLKLASISKAIKSLDQADLNAAQEDNEHGRMQSQNTKFAAGGATVEFDADPAIVVWKRVDAVRQVRRALRAKDFTGQSGKFIVDLKTGAGMNRSVNMSMEGKSKRIYFRSQMTSPEVWLLLDRILKHSK